MILISEARSVTASYWGTGVESYSSAGTFGLFSASARGTPFGGGSVYVGQTSNITPSEITIEHSLVDFYGPGGYGLSSCDVKFALPEATRITITGYCNYFSGSAGLVSESLGTIPLVWHGGPGDPSNVYRNYLDFDQVLGPGVYTFTSAEGLPLDAIHVTLALRATAVPDEDATALLLGLGVLSLLGVRQVGFRRLSAARSCG